MPNGKWKKKHKQSSNIPSRYRKTVLPPRKGYLSIGRVHGPTLPWFSGIGGRPGREPGGGTDGDPSQRPQQPHKKPAFMELVRTLDCRNLNSPSSPPRGRRNAPCIARNRFSRHLSPSSKPRPKQIINERRDDLNRLKTAQSKKGSYGRLLRCDPRGQFVRPDGDHLHV